MYTGGRRAVKTLQCTKEPVGDGLLLSHLVSRTEAGRVRKDFSATGQLL